MVKKKPGRMMNPTDAFRKEMRKKEIARNKKERQLQRETQVKKENPEVLKKELEEVYDLIQSGKASKNAHLRVKVLQNAYDAALKKKREEEVRKKQTDQASTSLWHGVPQRRPEDSVYYHPTKNPTGAPPPGKPQRYRDDVEDIPQTIPASLTSQLPVPQKPPLPAGPAPHAAVMDHLPPPPSKPPLPAGPRQGDAAVPVLPPPPGPPPGMATDMSEAAPGTVPVALPPPPGPPPAHPLAPPPHPPPGAPPGMMLFPPVPPPAGPPPARKEVKSVISGATTAVKRPLAQNDKTVTCMVPASVRVKRQNAQQTSKPALLSASHKSAAPEVDVFGLPAAPKPQVDQSYLDFMNEVSGLGAFDGVE